MPICTVTRTTLRHIARAIAVDLFTDGRGEVADRLVLVDKENKQGAGWCQQAVADRIGSTLCELLKPDK